MAVFNLANLSLDDHDTLSLYLRTRHKTSQEINGEA
jgi:hypothetical protein